MLEDLTGKRFGYLTVLERQPSLPRQPRMWRCRCDCGGEILSSTYRLTKGLTSHCGCRKIHDLTGQTFGKLTVLGLSDKRGKRGERSVILWECRCSCGAIVYKPTDALKNRSVSMCADCAGKHNAAAARKGAGFVDGTQVSRIRDMRPGEACQSGVRGVQFHKQSNLWRAQIKFRRRTISLGYFRDFQDAVNARKEAEEKYFGSFLEAYGRREGSGENT